MADRVAYVQSEIDTIVRKIVGQQTAIRESGQEITRLVNELRDSEAWLGEAADNCVLTYNDTYRQMLEVKIPDEDVQSVIDYINSCLNESQSLDSGLAGK